MTKLLDKAQPWAGTSYRNITTCFPSQDLFDDLGLDQTEIEIIQTWENKTSGIDHTRPGHHRVFQYGENQTSMAVFSRNTFFPGRFNTTAFGVWYGALEESTSIEETFYWFQKDAEEKRAFAKKDIVVDRKMFSAKLKSSLMVKLTSQKNVTTLDLTSEDYTLTQELGQAAKNQGIEMLLAPSARKQNGTCSPVFKPQVIQSEKTMYYLRFTMTQHGLATKHRFSEV